MEEWANEVYPTIEEPEDHPAGQHPLKSEVGPFAGLTECFDAGAFSCFFWDGSGTKRSNAYGWFRSQTVARVAARLTVAAVALS